MRTNPHELGKFLSLSPTSLIASYRALITKLRRRSVLRVWVKHTEATAVHSFRTHWEAKLNLGSLQF